MTYEAMTAELLACLADYWVVRELRFVEKLEHIRESLRNFNAEAAQFPDISRRAFKFWVYDPTSDLFGPNKFVGFRAMTFPKYGLADRIAKMELDRGRFNGHQARKHIRKVLKADYETDPELCGRLKQWAESLFGEPSVFSGRDPAKWGFLRLG